MIRRPFTDIEFWFASIPGNDIDLSAPAILVSFKNANALNYFKSNISFISHYTSTYLSHSLRPINPVKVVV